MMMMMTWDDIRLATASDPTMTTLTNTIEDGFPEDRISLDPDLRPYHQFREHLTTFDGVVLYHDRIVIPPSLRDRVLQCLHSAHQGVTQMLPATPRVDHCQICKLQPGQPPMTPDHDPSPGPVIEPLPPTPKATNSKAPVTGLARTLRVLMPHNAPGLKEQAARPRIDPSPGAPQRSARPMNPAHTPA
ncbi:polyprotein of retroviral origin [Plakobranchus ocellatus]|uniref:Polyprotein of retroviral origin n=1 Tax=Plakobranchus ocellatus TaxID=259542 RepID=A0AAV4CHR9_9GAST|nr:polyprotein of retroviral origin [Plakobranchus ocellatus]